MYCYYLAKAQGRGYLKRLEVMMKGKYPENRRKQKFTGNTLAAQCRYIEESNTIGKEKLQEIKGRAENLAKENNFEIPKQWWKWELKEKQILENEEVKILWEVPVRTDKKINANRPDIILINKQEKTVKLIDITVPQDYNIQKKAKKGHYGDLNIE